MSNISLRELHAGLLEGLEGETKGETSARADVEKAKMCHNTPIQLGRKSRQLLGVSHIHGWGAFAGVNIPKGEFVAEYR